MNNGQENYVADSVIITVCLAFIVLGSVAAKLAFPQYFNFQSNGYALFSALQVVANMALLAALFMRRGYVQARLWLALTISGSLMLGLGELLMRLSVSPQQALFWSHVSVIGLAIISVSFYMFSRAFISTVPRHFDIILPGLLTLTAAVLLAFTVGGESIALVNQARGFWGYAIPLSTSFLLLSLWLGVILILGLIELFGCYSRATEPTQKSQALVIMLGIGIAVFSGTFLDIVPRYFGLNILPIGILVQTLIPFSIIYAIYRYDTLTIDFSQTGFDILNALSEGVLVTDTNYKISTVNQFGLKLSGYSLNELVGTNLQELFTATDFTKVTNGISEGQSTNESIRVKEISLLMKDSASINVSLSIMKLAGSSPALLFTVNDISTVKLLNMAEQQRNTELETANAAFRNQQRAMMNLLEDSRDLGDQLAAEKASVERKVEQRTAEVKAERMRLEASINSLNVGFIIVDDKQQIITANQAFSEIINAPGTVTQPSLEQLARSLIGVYDIHKAINNCLAKAKETSKDGIQFGTKTLRIFMAPIFEATDEHKSLGVVVLVEDVTEVKAIERSRDEFFSIASHELRTPLTAIRGNTQMIKEYYQEALQDPSLAEMVDDIHDSSIRLITIVNDFLDTSRLEQGKIAFELTNFDVKDLVQDVIKEFRVGEVNPKLYVQLGTLSTELPLVRADRDRLKQTIINLIGNAFKFTELGGVTIDITTTAKVVSIAVTDTGKGIPAESQNLLFRKFQQASNNILTRDSTRSTGLGLYISKLIAEGMKGRIYMKESTLGKGSTFVIEMPVAPSKAHRLGIKKQSQTKA